MILHFTLKETKTRIMNNFPTDSMLRKTDSCKFNTDDLTGGLNKYGATSICRLKQGQYFDFRFNQIVL